MGKPRPHVAILLRGERRSVIEMLTLEVCKNILDEASPEGVEYQMEQVEAIRQFLYAVARAHLSRLEVVPAYGRESDHI